MPVLSEMPDSDSGVASPEIAPDDQISMDNQADISTKNKTDNISTTEDKKVTTLQSTTKSKGQDDCDEGIDDIDETLAERLMGLAEMFPDSIRSATATATNGTVSLIKGTYALSRQVVWVGVTTAVILFAPVMFELERYNIEEMAKQDRNRLVLGPSTAMSGSPGGGIPTR